MTAKIKAKINTVAALLPKFEEIVSKCEDLVLESEANEPDDFYVMAWERWNESYENKQQRFEDAEAMQSLAEDFAATKFEDEKECDKAYEDLVYAVVDYCVDYGGIKRVVKRLCDLIPGSDCALVASMRGAYSR